MSGEENISDTSTEKIKLTKLIVNKSGTYGYIATEYLGSANLQASIYLVKNKQYCQAGDLDAFTSFKIDKSIHPDGYYGVVIFSKAGPSQFSRTYKYVAGNYPPYKCEVTVSGKRKRICTENELWIWLSII